MRKLKRILTLALMSLSIMAVALPAAPASAQTGITPGTTAYVNITSGHLNIRSTPDHKSTTNIVASAIRGQALAILGETQTGTTVSGSSYWYRVQLQRSPYTQGWAHHSYISRTNPNTGATPPGVAVKNPEISNVNCPDMSYHYLHLDDYQAFARARIPDLSVYECTEYNEETGTTCNVKNKNYYIKLQFWGGTTSNCYNGCTIRHDDVKFIRCCSVCGVNNHQYDVMFAQDVHSKTNCPYQTGPDE